MTLVAKPSRTSSSAPRVREVDALRGIGAILVLLFHYTSRYQEMFPAMPGPSAGVNMGYDGVVIFFALSGFSIHFSLRRLTHMGDFAFARFARLFPAYWAALAVTVAVQFAADIPLFRLSVTEMLVNLTMLQGFAHVGLVDGAYWTLAVELCFYACMAVLWRTRLLGRLEWIVAGWLALALVMHGWSRFPEPIAQFLVLRHIHFFAIGLLCSRVHAGQRRWRQQLPFLGALILYIAWLEGPQILVVVGAALAFFIAMSAGHMRWVCVTPLLWVGAISYPLYLVHQHVGMTILIEAHEAGLGYWSGFAMATATALIAGSAIHRFIERPTGDWLLARWRCAASHPPVPARYRSVEPLLAAALVGPWAIHYWHGPPDALAPVILLHLIPFAAIALLCWRVRSGERLWRDQLPYAFLVMLTAAGTSGPGALLGLVATALVSAMLVGIAGRRTSHVASPSEIGLDMA